MSSGPSNVVSVSAAGLSLFEARRFERHEIALQPDANQVAAFRDELRCAIELASLETRNAIQSRLKFLDDLLPKFFDLVSTEAKLGAAPAGACAVRLRPTDCYRDFLAAVRANDIQAVIDQLNSPVG